MHCLQWFLPLVLFARPASSPLFLATYLLTMILRHQPCIMCSSAFVLLLVAAGYQQGYFWIDVTQPWYAQQFQHWADAPAST